MSRYIIVLMACLIVSVHSTELSNESKLILEKLKKSVEQSLISISSIEQKNGKDPRELVLNISVPAHEVVYLGMVIDPVYADEGLKVLSVTPGSVAEKVGLESNDLILRINGKNVDHELLASVTSNLRNLKDGDLLELKVRRSGVDVELSGSVVSYFVPRVELNIGNVVNEVKEEFEEGELMNGCGKVSVFLAPPISSSIEPGYFTYIDGYKIGREKSSFKLSPGWHSIELSSSISRHFGQGRLDKARTKPLKILIEENTVYYFGVDASEGDEKKKTVAWKQESQECL